MYHEKAIIKHKGKLLSETNIVRLLEDYQSEVALLRVGEAPSETTFKIHKNWAKYVDILRKGGYYDIVLLDNRGKDRLGGLDEMGVVKLSFPGVSFGETPGNPLLNEPDKIKYINIFQSYTTGDTYKCTFVVGVSVDRKNTYIPLL